MRIACIGLMTALGLYGFAADVVARRPESVDARKARASVVAMLASANVLDLHQSIAGSVPGPTDGFVELRSIRGELSFHDPRYFAERDDWGRALLYWSDGLDYAIVSYGADDAAEFDYGNTPPFAEIPRGTLTREPARDIVVVNGAVYYGPAYRNFGRATLSAMRALSTAVETYAIDNNDYPTSGDGAVPANALEAELVPTYILHLPVADEWGHPLLYWSDRVQFAVISTGADGVAELPYEMWQADDVNAYGGERTIAPAQDIVLINARFIQWPRSITAP